MKPLHLVTLAALAALTIPCQASAHDPKVHMGAATIVEGTVEMERHGKTTQIAPNEDLFLNDVITTGPDAKIRITFDDNTELTLGPDTVIDVDEYLYDPDDAEDPNFKLSILRGTFMFTSGLIKKDNVKIDIPHGSIGIRGTKFLAGDLGGKYGIFVDKGAVNVSNDAGTVIVGKNEGTKLTATDVPPSIPGTWSEMHKIQLKNRLRFGNTAERINPQ